MVVVRLSSDRHKMLLYTPSLYQYLIGHHSKSVPRVLIDITLKEGPQYLFKGLTPRLIATCNMMSVFYVLNEELTVLFLHRKL